MTSKTLPKPCAYCGGEKPPGRGRKACDPCLDKLKPVFARESTRKKLVRLRAERALEGRTRKLAKDAPEGQKWCPRCQQYLPLEDFNEQTGKSGGRAAYCRECQSVFHFEHRLKTVYKITLDRYEEMYEQQGGRCAVCLCKPRSRRLAVDHDHRTGEVRGLLCTRCNHKVIGAAKEDPAVLRRAAQYLDQPPAVTGDSLDELGWWDEARLEAAMTETEKEADNAGARVWAAVVKRRQRNAADAFVVMPLRVFAELLRDDQADRGAA